MTDVFTKSKRSSIMASIRSSNTKPELKVKKALHGLGFSYQPKIKGKPDFINKKTKVAIFVNGCFWHGCSRHYKEPKTNKSYWRDKIISNMQRDKKNKIWLKNRGWRVITIWQHELNSNYGISFNKKLRSISMCGEVRTNVNQKWY